MKNFGWSNETYYELTGFLRQAPASSYEFSPDAGALRQKLLIFSPSILA
ncbi:hypothetical protein [Microcoleus sp. Pol12B4]